MSADGFDPAPKLGETSAAEVVAEWIDAAEPMLFARISTSRAKRGLDLILALMLLIFVLPLLVFVAITVLVDSRGPVLFVQRRTGFGGKAIRVLKFRTMSVMEDGDVIPHAQKNDQRVTRIGGFLRRSSIDELPQLWNVLRGDMSLVGPRPHALAHDEYYAALVPDYARRFRARPGITGLAQVSGHRGPIHGAQGMAARVAADNLYIDTWTLVMDAKILVRTALGAPFHTNAY